MKRNPFSAMVVLLSAILLLFPAIARADYPGNLLQNPDFEGGSYNSQSLGTSLSSNVANGWTPWSILGDATFNREVEYKVLDISTLPSGYNIHSGNRSMKFFTSYGSHTAGFYQRVPVTPGTQVTFSIWVQIYTGERELVSYGNPISDLEWPKEHGDKQGPGLYRAYAGIDPYGETPPGFGAPPSANTVWSAPITDFETRVVDEQGREWDAWVQLTVSTVAKSDHVTVYTKGQPEYPVKHNDSFWDDACLTTGQAALPTQPPTDTPPPTPEPSDASVDSDVSPEAETTEEPVPVPTAESTATAVPTEEPEEESVDTATPTPTDVPPTATPSPTATAEAPTATAVPPTPTEAPVETVTAIEDSETPVPPEDADERGGSCIGGLLAIYGGLALASVSVPLWLLFLRRR